MLTVMRPVYDKASFIELLPTCGRLLAIDHGSQRIGLAITDESRRFVNPLETLAHAKFAVNATALQRICDEYTITGLVIGYPLNMDGTEGARCQSVRQFTRNLEHYITLPTLLWDERLSSNTAHDLMVDAGLRAAQRGRKIDKLAAAAILQSFLDAA